MATNLGKVGIVDKGNYSLEATYNSGDFIFYEGSTWLALKDGLTGIKPTEGEAWKYLARGVPDGIARPEQVGVVKPSEDLTITKDGTLGINTVFETIAERANIESGDTWKTVLGKINKYFGDIKPHSFLDKITEDYIDSVITQKVNNAIQNSAVVNNAVTTVEGTVLDGRMGKTLQDQINDQNKNIQQYSLETKKQYRFKNLSQGLETWSASIPDQTVYKFVATQSAGLDPILGGGNMLIEGHKTNSLYEWQKATCYNKGVKWTLLRNKYDGIWGDWDKFILNSDLKPSLVSLVGKTCDGGVVTHGGYYKIGNLVVLNLRVSAYEQKYSMTFDKILPSYKLGSNCVSLSVFDVGSSPSPTSRGCVTETGDLLIHISTSSGAIISGAYICN